MQRVDRTVRRLELCLQVSQGAFVFLDLRLIASLFLNELRRLGFLSVLACLKIAFGDLLVQTGQFVLGVVELLD